jgi:hypothetical protein
MAAPAARAFASHVMSPETKSWHDARYRAIMPAPEPCLYDYVTTTKAKNPAIKADKQ